MKKIKRNHLKEAFATAKAAVFWFTLFGSFFIVFGVISLERVLTIGANHTFLLGNVSIPLWEGAGATNLSVFIMCAVGILVVLFSLLYRYFYHRKKLEYLRKMEFLMWIKMVKLIPLWMIG